ELEELPQPGQLTTDEGCGVLFREDDFACEEIQIWRRQTRSDCTETAILQDPDPAVAGKRLCARRKARFQSHASVGALIDRQVRTQGILAYFRRCRLSEGHTWMALSRLQQIEELLPRE